MKDSSAGRGTAAAASDRDSMEDRARPESGPHPTGPGRSSGRCKRPCRLHSSTDKGSHRKKRLSNILCNPGLVHETHAVASPACSIATPQRTRRLPAKEKRREIRNSMRRHLYRQTTRRRDVTTIYLTSMRCGRGVNQFLQPVICREHNLRRVLQETPTASELQPLSSLLASRKSSPLYHFEADTGGSGKAHRRPPPL